MHTLVALALALSSSLSPDDPCIHLDVASLDQLLPDLAPWSQHVGGAGRCSFTSRSDQPMGRFSLTYQPQRTAAAATDLVRSLRGASEGGYRVTRIPGLGVEAFSYEPTTPTPGTQPTIWWVGHRDRLVVRGTLSLPPQRPLRDREPVFRFLEGALALDPAVLAEQLTCPWFDDQTLERLLGPDITAQSLGDNSCLATTRPYGPSLVATVFRRHDRIAIQAGSTCSWQPVPEFGATARLGLECEGKPSHAALDLPVDDLLVRYTLNWPDAIAPETATALVDLARAVAASTDGGHTPGARSLEAP